MCKIKTANQSVFLSCGEEIDTIVNNHIQLSLAYTSTKTFNIVKLKTLQKTEDIKIWTVIVYFQAVITGEFFATSTGVQKHMMI